MPQLSDDEKLAVERVRRWLGEVQDVTSGSLSLDTVRTLLLVAEQPGISVVEVAERLGKSRGLASRQLLDLGVKRRQQGVGLVGREEVGGFGLVEPYIDPDDLRLKRYRCTPKGVTVARKLARIVGVQGSNQNGAAA